MAVTPGTRLGVYEITSQLGAGGMGEVYRATDGNLKCQVAINSSRAALVTEFRPSITVVINWAAGLGQ